MIKYYGRKIPLTLKEFKLEFYEELEKKGIGYMFHQFDYGTLSKISSMVFSEGSDEVFEVFQSIMMKYGLPGKIRQRTPKNQ